MRAGTIVSRFWQKVEKRAPDECWNWTAATNERGYGVIRPDGVRSGPSIKAHRLSAQMAGMDIEAGKVLHSCDNPRCVNPAHLRVGSMQENADDMVARNRVSWGEGRPGSKLTAAAVIEMRRRRAAGETVSALAREFGVGQSIASRAITGATWKRVPGAVSPPAARDVLLALKEAA